MSGFPLSAMHKNIRFTLGSNRDVMRLILTMVRDGACSVEQAMDCILFDESDAYSQVDTCPICGASIGDGEFKSASGHYLVSDKPCPLNAIRMYRSHIST